MERLFIKKLNIVRRYDTGDVQFARSAKVHNRIILFFLIFAMGAAVLLLIAKLFQLTIVKGAYYRRLSEENRIRQILIEAKRGSIMDRKGIVLAENEPGDISLLQPRIPSKRTYAVKEEVAHLVGYRQVADRQDIINDTCQNRLSLGDKVGKKGIEELYDCLLRGISGRKLVEVDANGKYLRTLSVIPPQKGADINLAVDYELQKKAHELIRDKNAVVVGLNPRTGEVLVFASSPSFDPQSFEDGDEVAAAYFTDETKPLFNRITEGVYPPGSLFKLFVSAGILEEKKMTPGSVIEDTGTIQAGPLSFGNWYYLQYGKTEGPVTLVKALQRSNDIYFYKAGEKLGPEGIKKWASIFGLNDETRLGFAETDSTIPSPLWKEEALKERWYLGDTYNMSIGQGYTLVTPIQMAAAVMPFANGGLLCRPQFLKNSDPECRKLPVADSTFEVIREGMLKACQPGGTGWPLFDFSVDDTFAKLNEPEPQKDASQSAVPQIKIPLGCKTGTAESHAVSGKPHAWFTVFAPFENPEILLTVLIEEGGQGSDVAAPIAREILKIYFERTQ